MSIMRLGLAAVVLAACVSGVAYRNAPGFRDAVDREIARWGEWTDEARGRDPVGFVGHAKGQLQRDVGQMAQTRGDLVAVLDKLDGKIREQQALLAYAEQFADEFRTAAQDAAYPVTVRGAAYTEDALVRQVSLLLAEAEGYKAGIDRLEAIRQQARAKYEELTVRLNRTESQLAALPAQRELLRVRKLSEDGEQLVAQVDELMQGNRRAIVADAVRSVQELLAGGPAQPEPRPTLAAAREFLARGKRAAAARDAQAAAPVREIAPASHDEPVADDAEPAEAEVHEPADDAELAKPIIRKQRAAKARHKPIFVQW